MTTIVVSNGPSSVKHYWTSWYGVASICMLVLSGCGSSDYSSVSGVVTIDEQPVPDAMVAFMAPGKPMSTARTDMQGRFVMETGSTEGMKPGEYSVTVKAFKKSESGKRTRSLLTPRKYTRPETSGLTALILEGEPSDLEFDLQSE